MKKRMDQINELITKALGQIILEEIELPEGVFVTISYVDVSPNLKNAFVYVSIFPFGKKMQTMEILERKAKQIRKSLGSKIKIKFTPSLKFRLDSTEEEASKIDALLDGLEIQE